MTAATITLTIFQNAAASTKREETWSVARLAREIKSTRAPEKRALPWLKLATFGDLRTEKFSLRHDANVLQVFGLEGDYDAEQMQPGDAAEKLRKAGVYSLVYTSPSHTPDKPRWRVLCPLAAPCPPAQRAHFMGRLNGLFGGIFADESWTLSQSYYYGKVGDNPAHMVEVIDGTPIDLHDDLDEIWIGKPDTTASTGAQASGPMDESALLAEIASGKSYHRSMARLAGSWAHKGVSMLNARARLVVAMEAVPEAQRDSRWKDRFADLDRTLLDIYVKNAAKGDTAPVPSLPPQWGVIDLDTILHDRHPAPPLHLHDIFPSPWAAWIDRAAVLKGCPVDYPALALLTASAALIGNARAVSPWDSWIEPAIVFAALVGNPSAGKSPAIDTCQAALARIEDAENSDYADRQRDYEGQKIEVAERRKAHTSDVATAIKNKVPPPQLPAAAQDPTPPERRRIYTTQPTTEKAARLSAANPRGLLLLRDELAGWLGEMGKYNSAAAGADRAFWLQSYGARPWTPDRVKDGAAEVAVPRLTWSILGGIQPDRLNDALLRGSDDGLPARFLYVWPSTRAAIDEPVHGIPLENADPWFAALRSLSWTAPHPIVLPLAQDAKPDLQAFRHEVREAEDCATGLMLGWLGKQPGYALRLALVFELLAWCCQRNAPEPKDVSRLSLQRAIAFLTSYAAPMARRCFGEAALPPAERDGRRLLRWLIRQQPVPTTINARMLRRAQHGPGIADAEAMDAALCELEGLGIVRRAGAGNTGRPRKDWEIHPEVLAYAD